MCDIKKVEQESECFKDYVDLLTVEVLLEAEEMLNCE